MLNTASSLKKPLIVTAAIVLLVFLSQWLNFNWGRLELGTPATITVTGKADGTHANQIATFYASVNADDADRDTAVRLVSEQMNELIEQVKAFGIPDEDMQTENLSVYEYTEAKPMMVSPDGAAMMPVEPPVRESGEARWQASNTLTVTLRDVSKASELATLLTTAGATTLSGPNFTTDDTAEMDRQLLQEAMEDARQKADVLLAGTGQRVLRVVNIYENESYAPYPMYREAAMSAGDSMSAMPVEPGSQTLYKSVTVIFELSR